MNELAVTVLGPDRPGIVAEVTEALAGVGANLTDSTMTRLGGHFTMTLICIGPDIAEVEKALVPVTADGQLLVSVRRVPAEAERVPPGEPHLMSVHGADRLGIVAALTRVLAQFGGNITDLTTRLSGSLYVVLAEVELPPGTAGPLADRLAGAAAELGVEVSLRPTESDLF